MAKYSAEMDKVVPKLSVKFRSRDLEERFKAYANFVSTTYTDLANDFFQSALGTKRMFSSDVRENLKELAYFLEKIDYAYFLSLHRALTSEPLTRNLKRADLAVAIFAEGVKVYKEKYARSLTTDESHDLAEK